MPIDYTIAPTYTCNICEQEHEKRWQAEDCCDVVSESYKCPFFHHEHDGHQSALNCCGERFEAGEVPYVRCPKTIDMFERKQ